MNISSVVCGVSQLDEDLLRCPVCNKPGKKMMPKTLKNMLKDDRLPNILEDYCLCLSKDCDAVYFGQQVFFKDDVKVKVWFKENDPSVPVCYCKNVTEVDIIEHIVVTKCCGNLKDIQEHTGANTGKECLIKNPAGT